MKQIDFEGTVHQFPDDFSEQEIAAALDFHAPAPTAEPPSLGGRALQAALNVVVPVTKKIDAFTGNPIRKGISAMQDEADEADPSFANLPGAFVQGATQGFGRNNAPEGKAIFERAGYSGEAAPVSKYSPPPGAYPHMAVMGDGVSTAGGLGFLLDLATPVPGLGEAKAAGTVTMKMAKAAGKEGLEAGGKAISAAAKVADVATNTKAATKGLAATKGALGAAEKGFKDLGEAMTARFGSKLAPDAPKWIAVAKRNGVDPAKLHESVLFGPSSSAAHIARHKAEGPLGEGVRKQFDETTAAIQDAIQGDIRRVGGEVRDEAGKVTATPAIPGTAQEAGDLIKTAYDSKVDEIMGGMDVTYGGLAKRAPKAKIPPAAMKKLNDHLDELQTYATDLGIDSFDEVTTSQAKHLLATIDKVRNAGDNFPAVVRGMQGLGRTAFKVKTPVGQIPPDLAKLRGIYGQLSDAVTAGAEANFGKDVANQLRANNKTMSEMFGDKALIPSLGNAGKSEDKLFRSLILEGDSKRINTLKKYLSPEQVQQVKAAALKVLLKEDKGFKTMRNRLSNKEDAFNALFDKGELDNLHDLIDLGDRQGRVVLSSSGTGGSLAHQAFTLGDVVRPGKWLDKAEAGVDKVAAAKQKAAATKAIGFETPIPQRAAAQGNPLPPAMGFAPGKTLQQMIHGGPAFKKKSLQVWGAQDEDKKK